MNQTQAIQTLFGAAGSVVNSTFRRMDIAEQEIAAAQKHTPRCKVLINGVFQLACPSMVLHNKSDDLYRHHVRELIDRVIAGDDTRPGTRAEVLASMVDTSLDSPLNRAGQAVYEHLFAELYGTAKLKELGLETALAKEFGGGQVQDDIHAAQRRLADPKRK